MKTLPLSDKIKLIFQISFLVFGLLLIQTNVFAKNVLPSDKSALHGEITSGEFGKTIYNWFSNDKYDVYCPEESLSDCEAHIKWEDPDFIFHGKAWSENVGWIIFDKTEIKLAAAETCPLSGKSDLRLVSGQAWGPTFGWIDFSYSSEFATCLDEKNGVFYGKGWSESVGTLLLGDPTLTKIEVDIIPTPDSEVEIKDPSGPSVSEEALTFKADQNKILNVIYPLQGGGSDLDKAYLEVDHINGIDTVLYDNDASTLSSEDLTLVNNSDTAIVSFQHNFRDANSQSGDPHGIRTYHLKTTLIDQAGNTTKKEFELRVVAGELDLSQSDCLINTNLKKIADGKDKYQIEKLSLKDRYGNPISYVNGIKSAEVQIDFENNNDTNQLEILGNNNLGDATCFYSDDFGIGKWTCGPQNNHVLESILSPTPGEYGGLEVRAFAPTSDVYSSATTENIVKISRLELLTKKLTTDNSVSDIGAGTFNIPAKSGSFSCGSASDPFSFSFLPLVENVLSGNPISDPFPKVLTEGVGEKFNLELKNNSNQAVDAIKIDVSGHCITDDTIECVFKDLETGKTGTGSYSLLADSISHYNTENNGMTNTDQSVKVGGTYNRFTNSPGEDTRLQEIMPVATFGKLFGSGATISEIRTEIAYQLDDSGTVNMPIIYNGTAVDDLDVLSNELSLSGRIRSDVVGPVEYFNIGSIQREDVIEAIYKEKSILLRGVSHNDPLDGGGSLSGNSRSWNSSTDHAIPGYNGDILYYKGDLTIDDLSISGQKTIIVENGEIYLKGNISYQDGASLGVLVLQGESAENKNVYIYPEVTDIRGIWYVEGSVFSFNPNETEDSCNPWKIKIYDGCNTSSNDLVNQLYIKGSIISYNTIAGSRKNPPELPIGVVINGFSGKTQLEKMNIAQGYDLKYLRQFLVDNPATPEIDPSGEHSAATEDASVVIEYDPSILTDKKIPYGFTGVMNISAQQSAQ